MSPSVVKLGIASLMPVALAVILVLAEKKTPYGKWNRNVRNLICGVLFGALAILGTEWGVPMNGAQVNCRDAAVLTAGLIFSAPAGIIAGIIGAAERWFAVYWGVGEFTRIACTVSTFLAGLYAAGLRKLLFEDKKPGWMLSLATGVVMEVFHLTMVFVTNMATPIEAMEVVHACSMPMIAANGLSVMLASLACSLLSMTWGKKVRTKTQISTAVQRWLLVTVVLAFIATTVFVFRLQDEIASVQTDTLLELALSEVVADIRDASDQSMIRDARLVAGDISSSPLSEIAKHYKVTEINVVGRDGIITASTVPGFIGYNMADGAQSAEFLCLLEGKTEFAQKYQPISLNDAVWMKYVAVKYGDGFVQIGYDEELIQKKMKEQIADITKNRSVGKTGFILILDDEMIMVSAPAGTPRGDYLHQNGVMPKIGKTFTVTVNDEKCFGKYELSEGYYVLSVLPEAEALQMRNIALYVNTFLEVIVFAILFGLIYLLIKRLVVDQIHTVNMSLSRITDGNLNEVVNVRSTAEFELLSDDINSTVDTLKRYIAEASARIDKELEFAREIQSSALPDVFPKRDGFEIYALMDPAKEVGGDFYDFYTTGSNTIHFLAADVSGKGIPAAMFMMRAKTELKSLTEAGKPVSEVFTEGNNALCEGNEAGMFVTAWQGGLDLTTGKVRFANAGHNPPLVGHSDGTFTYLKSSAGLVLAGMEDMTYRSQETVLAPGDIIFLYTDGVTEAQNAAGELFGEDRLLEAISRAPRTDMRELCESVKKSVDGFVGDAPQFDDITMLALCYFGPEKE